METRRNHFEEWAQGTLLADNGQVNFQRLREDSKTYCDTLVRGAWEIWQAAWLRCTRDKIDESQSALLREQLGLAAEREKFLELEVINLKTELRDLGVALRVNEVELALATGDYDDLLDDVLVSPEEFEKYVSVAGRIKGMCAGKSLKEVAQAVNTYGEKYVAKLRADTKAKAEHKVKSAAMGG